MKAYFARDMLGKSDLQAAWFSISARRHHADDGPVSFGFTSVNASDRWREAKWIRATFCLLKLTQILFWDLFKTRKNGGVQSNRPVFVHEQVESWAMELMESRKECEWREVLLCLKYQWGRCCQVLEHTRGNRSSVNIKWTRHLCTAFYGHCEYIVYNGYFILFYFNYIILNKTCSLSSVFLHGVDY